MIAAPLYPEPTAPLARFGLGAVQFGLDYGVSNSGGKVAADEVARILAAAAELGVDLIDTAAAYGESEAALGVALPPAGAEAGPGFRLVSKAPPFADVAHFTAEHEAQLLASAARSVERLGGRPLDALLLHNAGVMSRPGAAFLVDGLKAAQAQGLTRRIGVSIYEAAELAAVQTLFRPDLVQLPINLLDQRLIKNGALQALHEQGVEIHARSLFLQGLLLMDPAAAPPYFDPIRPTLVGLRAAAAAIDATPLAVALGFGLSVPQLDRLVVGVTSATELRQIAAAALHARTTAATLDYGRFALDDPDFVNPARWRLAAPPA